jgi:hypothetical protein
VRQREFIDGAATWPLVARAQQPALSGGWAATDAGARVAKAATATIPIVFTPTPNF